MVDRNQSIWRFYWRIKGHSRVSKAFLKSRKRNSPGIFFAVVHLITLSIERRFSPINLSPMKAVWSLEISTVEKFWCAACYSFCRSLIVAIQKRWKSSVLYWIQFTILFCYELNTAPPLWYWELSYFVAKIIRVKQHFRHFHSPALMTRSSPVKGPLGTIYGYK